MPFHQPHICIRNGRNITCSMVNNITAVDDYKVSVTVLVTHGLKQSLNLSLEVGTEATGDRDMSLALACVIYSVPIRKNTRKSNDLCSW